MVQRPRAARGPLRCESTLGPKAHDEELEERVMGRIGIEPTTDAV
jgi:hypothetical protein